MTEQNNSWFSDPWKQEKSKTWKDEAMGTRIVKYTVSMDNVN